jgi:hypothetical protein
VNFNGQIFYNGMALSQPFTSCCNRAQTGTFNFCAPSIGSQFGLYTCN